MAGIPFFVEPLPFTVINGSSGPSDRPASHLAEFKYAGMVWRSNAGSFHTVTLDFGAPVTIDHVSLLNTNAQPGTQWFINAGATQANAEGGSPSFATGDAPLISPAVTGRDRYHGFRSFSAQTYRYWVVGMLSHTGTFEASILAAGRRISTASYYEPEWEAGPEDLGTLAYSRNGVPEIADGATLRRLGFNLQWVTEAETESLLLPMLGRLGRRGSVLCCFDPDATVYRQGRTYFGTLADQGRMRKIGFNRFEKRFEIVSII